MNIMQSMKAFFGKLITPEETVAPEEPKKPYYTTDRKAAEQTRKIQQARLRSSAINSNLRTTINDLEQECKHNLQEARRSSQAACQLSTPPKP